MNLIEENKIKYPDWVDALTEKMKLFSSTHLVLSEVLKCLL